MFFDILDVSDVNVLYFFHMLSIKKKRKTVKSQIRNNMFQYDIKF